MKDITLVTCSYNTPEITMTLLRSFYFHHRQFVGKISSVIMENSTNDRTVELLDVNKIPYIRTPGATHSVSVDAAFKKVKTKYALLVDTDVVFHTNMFKVYNLMKTQEVASLGLVVGSRGGYNLFPRIHPWFNLVDMEQINKFGISFHDQERLNKTNSTAFFNNIPINTERTGKYYDVGSTFLEDILKHNLKVYSVNAENKLFTHYEGMSWHEESGIESYKAMKNRKMVSFRDQYTKYMNVDIRNRYK